MNARREAVVPLSLRGPGGIVLGVEALIDTGFTASLTVPAAAVAALGLVRETGSSATLADGSVRQFDVFAAEASWNGAWRPVTVYMIGDETLMGMRLLSDHLLRIEATPGGAVEIAPLV